MAFSSEETDLLYAFEVFLLVLVSSFVSCTGFLVPHQGFQQLDLRINSEGKFGKLSKTNV